MDDKERKIALFACKQGNTNKYTKEIEDTGIFLSDIDEMMCYIAMQPNRQWQAFDYEPLLTEHGWNRQGDRPDNLTASGDVGLHWSKTLCKHERYHPKIKRMRRKFIVKGFKD